MKNKIFKLMSAAEKRRYLTAVLRRGTGGALDGKAIRHILKSISINRQYNVSAFPDIRVFQLAVTHAKNENVLLSVIYPRHGNIPVAAVFRPARSSGADTNKRAVYIHTPNRRTRKGVAKWTKATRNV